MRKTKSHKGVHVKKGKRLVHGYETVKAKNISHGESKDVFVETGKRLKHGYETVSGEDKNRYYSKGGKLPDGTPLYTKDELLKKYKGKFIDHYTYGTEYRNPKTHKYETVYEVRGVSKTIKENYQSPEEIVYGGSSIYNSGHYKSGGKLIDLIPTIEKEGTEVEKYGDSKVYSYEGDYYEITKNGSEQEIVMFEFEQGDEFGFGGHLKSAFNKAKEKAKEAHSKTKKFVGDKKHEINKRIATDALLDLTNNYEEYGLNKKDRQIIDEALNLTLDHYKKGGKLGKNSKAISELKKDIEHRWVNTNMGSGWEFYLRQDGDIVLKMKYLDSFDGDYDYEEWKYNLYESSYEDFLQLAIKEKLYYYYMENGGIASTYKKGGKLNYIPHYKVEEVTINKNGKEVEIDGEKILNGIYILKGTKFEEGGRLDEISVGSHIRVKGYRGVVTSIDKENGIIHYRGYAIRRALTGKHYY